MNKKETEATLGAAKGAASATKIPRYLHLVQSITELNEEFGKTNGKDYHDFVKRALQRIFDLEPYDNVNGITKEDIEKPDGFTVHHEIPQRKAAENPEAMTDLGNMDPLSRDDHDAVEATGKMRNGETAEDVLTHVERKRFRYCMETLIDSVISPFVIGFFATLFYSLISAGIRKDETERKGALKNALRAGLAMMLFALPFGLTAVILMLCGVSESTINIVQICLSVPVLLFGWYFAFGSTYLRTGKKGRAFLALLVSVVLSLIFFFICLVGELIEMKINGWLLGVIVSDIYLIAVMILFCFLIDLVTGKYKKTHPHTGDN